MEEDPYQGFGAGQGGDFALRLQEDLFAAGAGPTTLQASRNRVIYVVSGSATIAHGGGTAAFGENQAWYGCGSPALTAGAGGAHLLRWELTDLPAIDGGVVSGAGVNSHEKLSAPVSLAPDGAYLMRCDRVDFPPGGVAYLHTHQGPGIRCLLMGELTVSVNGTSRTIGPLGAWFEAGPDPVFASASATTHTGFVRVMILPLALKGKSSIAYVNAEDREKPKSQRYTIFIDEAIAPP